MSTHYYFFFALDHRIVPDESISMRPLNQHICSFHFAQSVLSTRMKKLDRNGNGISRSFLRSNRGMPAVQEHLNGATGRTSIARCGLPCRRSGSRRRGTRFEEAVVDWKSYMLPVEWTISLSLLHCERSLCCPFSFLSLPLFQFWADARLGVPARDSCRCTHCSLSFLEFRVPSFFLRGVDTTNRAVSPRPAPRFSFVHADR